MGQAKRRSMETQSVLQSLQDHVPCVSLALRKLAIAASPQIGRDCYAHAELGRLLLADLDIQAHTVVGYAAWRIGPGSGDVIAHVPQAESQTTANASGLMYHTWLECADVVIDFTTYQFATKARELDALDGGTTQVEWRPDFLLLSKQQTCRFSEVRQSFDFGLAYYEARPALDAVLRKAFSVDPRDVHTARLILQNPDLHVVGPNHLSRMGATP